MRGTTTASAATTGRSPSLDHAGREKIQCELCAKYFHRLDVHIKAVHGKTPEQYIEQFPGRKVRSDHAEAVMAEAGRKAARVRVEGKGKGKPAEKVVAEEAEVAPLPGEFKFGVARLFERDDVEEDSLRFIPEHDAGWIPGRAEKSALEDLALGIQDKENCLMVGPTGCGKSLLAMQLACSLGQPMRRVNLHGDVRASDFTGEKIVDVDRDSGQSVVKWRDGVLPQAMRAGHWLLLDELDAAPASILFVLQGVLETGRRLVLTGNGGEVVESHEHFRIIATANTVGRGDDTGLYQGTRVLNEAFLDRFGTVIDSRYPTKDTEARILQERAGIEKDLAMSLVGVAHRVREAFDKDEVGCTFSTRRLVAWAIKTAHYKSARRAAGVAVLNKLTPDDRKIVDGVIQRHLGES